MKVMRQDKYDADSDGIADFTNGIPVVTEFPASPKVGDMVIKNGKVYVCINIG